MCEGKKLCAPLTMQGFHSVAVPRLIYFVKELQNDLEILYILHRKEIDAL